MNFFFTDCEKNYKFALFLLIYPQNNVSDMKDRTKKAYTENAKSQMMIQKLKYIKSSLVNYKSLSMFVWFKNNDNQKILKK